MPLFLGKMATGKEVIAAVSKLSSSLKKMVVDGQAGYEKSKDINDFVKSHGTEHLHGLLTVYPVQLYADCFKSLAVNSRTSLEAVWAKYPHNSNLQQCVEELLAAEESYEAFISELDREMNSHEESAALPVVTKGGCLCTDATFVECPSGKDVSLTSVLEKGKYTLFVLRKHYV